MEIQSIKQRYGIVGSSPGLNYAISIASRVAPTNLTVLITGESGVGKEIFSQIIHHYSARKHGKFIAVNCGAIPEGTIDSELFGHEKGAFTGALDKRKGYFETVDGGTIFLDEIGEMPLGTQARLLRVLESGEFIKVGSSQAQKTDVRVVAATNVNLLELIKNGKFREDLYYRLSTVPIEIPALRERGDDIYLLFRKFIVDFAERNRVAPVKLDESAKEVVVGFNWPGNVRQLKNVAEQVTILAKSREISGEEMKSFLPKTTVSKLPALHDAFGQTDGGFSERELLYKLLFEMKKDINELKKWMFEIGQNGKIPTFENPPQFSDSPILENFQAAESSPEVHAENKPIIIQDTEDYSAETVEESLSIADKEKELILKALEKHKGKRKRAAEDLGISERTLYRKIREYEVDEA